MFSMVDEINEMIIKSSIVQFYKKKYKVNK